MEEGRYIYISDTFNLSPKMIQIPEKYQGYLESTLVSHGTIKDRIAKLAEDIVSSSPSQDLIFLCILRGAFRFCNDLMVEIGNYLHSTDHTHVVEYIRARSYVNDSQEEVTVEGLESLNLRGRHVIIVEDMVDRGNTLLKLSEIIRAKEPASLRIAVLAYKRNPVNTFIVPDFIGFSLPNKWIVGYNIDYNGHFRDLSHISVVNDEGKVAFRST